MNERIRELAEQATSSCIQYDPKTMMTERIQEFDKEKFAELLIRKCMRMCDCADSSYLEHGCDLEASGAAGAKQFIKEWFEVEE
jgi:hypothetical protein